MKKASIVNMVLAALGAALISVCSWVSIPMTVPFTLQTFAVFCVLVAFGYKVGLTSIVVYILIGAIGLPVFSNFQSGIGALLGATGGYIVGFIFIGIAYAVAQKLFPNKIIAEIIALLVGLLICYSFGTFWFMFVYTKNTGAITLSTALSWCVLPFIIPDVIKMLLAVLISKKIKPVIEKYKYNK